MISRCFFVALSLLAVVACAPEESHPAGTTVSVPSLIPDEAYDDDVEPKVRVVTSDDPAIVKVTPPDPTAKGYRGYNIVCLERGTTNVRITADDKHFVVPVRVFRDFIW